MVKGRPQLSATRAPHPTQGSRRELTSRPRRKPQLTSSSGTVRGLERRRRVQLPTRRMWARRWLGTGEQRFECPFTLSGSTKQCSQGQRQAVSSNFAAVTLVVADYGAACVEIIALASALQTSKTPHPNLYTYSSLLQIHSIGRKRATSPTNSSPRAVKQKQSKKAQEGARKSRKEQKEQRAYDNFCNRCRKP